MYAIVDTPVDHHDQSPCSDCDIRTASICGALHDDELSELDHLAHRKRYDGRVTLFSEGDPGKYVFNVREGVIRLSRLLSDGRRQILGFVLPGDFLGLSLRDPYDFTAETIGEVEACRFERQAFIEYVEAKPHLLRSLHMATAHELALGREQMVLLGRRTAEEKVAAFLLSLRSRYRRIITCDVTVPLPMTRQDIADYCGLTLETVSRVFSKLAREKVILNVPDGVRLVMLDRLRALVA
jgi:CRP/FNR family transcriptional regulator